MTDNRAQLLPCPFCGGEGQPSIIQAGGIEWAQVECVEKGCCAAGPTPATEAEAIAAWNTRAAIQGDHPTDALNKAEADEDEAYKLGKDDGRSEALAELDRLAGGDGEYRYCTIPDARHCPDADAMRDKIVARLRSAEAERDLAREELARVREALRPFAQALEDCGDDEDIADRHYVWESAIAMNVTYGHFRQALAAWNAGR